MDSDLSCLPTGIGSMPHTSPKEARDLILQNLKEIPFWPQFPNLSFKEQMYAQNSYLLPGAIVDEVDRRVYIDTTQGEGVMEDFLNEIIAENIDYFAYSKEYFHGLYEMLRMEDSLKNTKVFKGQITGPISLGFQVTDENRKPIFYNDLYRDIIPRSLKLIAKWQEKTLRILCDMTLVLLDDPFLSMIGSGFVSLSRDKAIEHLNEVLSGIEGMRGIHCCGNTDWGFVLETDIDVLSFDAYSYANTLCLYPENVKKFLEREGIIAWGIVPTNEEHLDGESPDSLVTRLENNMKTLSEKGISIDDILTSSLIMTSCGLGSATVRCAEKAIVTLNEVSKKMREKHGL